jgi:folate-binding protein YgfZ
MEGYRALRENAAVIDVSDRGKILLYGEDRARLLHALTTNHIQQLTPGQACYAFFLNAQGKILSDAIILCYPEYFLVGVEPGLRETIYQHLDHYIIADDVTLEDATEKRGALSIEGPKAREAIARLGAPTPEERFAHTEWEGRTVFRVSFTGLPGYRIILPREEVPAMIEKLAIESADEEAANVVRIEHGKPRYGYDIFPTTLPMETQQSQAVHFNKGCYLGQEVVERVRSRGHLNRLLVGVVIDSTAAPEPKSELLAGEEPVGKMASSAFSPGKGKIVGMAYIRVPHTEPGTRLTVNGVPAVTTPLGG